jgi:3-dehydroquinate dehydratase type II
VSEKKILVINGPNLNMLGVREPEIYGRETYDDLVKYVTDGIAALGATADFFQSNHEGAIVDEIQNALGKYDAIVINPAAYTHTSVALLDAVKAVGIPTAEVHISDVSKREDFRQISYIRAACVCTVAGRGFAGYVEAARVLLDKIGGKK